jgi:myo-inositol-1(or 4)-monophosphatase
MTAMAGLTVASTVVVVAGVDVLDVLGAAASAVRSSLDVLDDWGLAGTRPGQYRSDLAADDAAVEVLGSAGFGVLSEESGLHDAERDVLVVVDPVDGSTNASRGLPWFATSLCALDADGPLAALVVNQATDQQFAAVRGGGAWASRRGSSPRVPLLGRRGQGAAVTSLGSAVVLLSGYPGRHLGWKQYRALGAAALDLCAVAAGMADAYVDCSRDAHGSWDYLGGYLVCAEAGVPVVDAMGRDLVVRTHEGRRTPVAAATQELLDELLGALAKKG